MLFPGDLVIVDKPSFLLCCSRQGVSHDWIGNILDMKFPIGIILTKGREEYDQVIYDNEWSTTTSKKNIMYKVYICGKIIKINERAIGDKVL